MDRHPLTCPHISSASVRKTSFLLSFSLASSSKKMLRGDSGTAFCGCSMIVPERTRFRLSIFGTAQESWQTHRLFLSVLCVTSTARPSATKEVPGSFVGSFGRFFVKSSLFKSVDHSCYAYRVRTKENAASAECLAQTASTSVPTESNTDSSKEGPLKFSHPFLPLSVHLPR